MASVIIDTSSWIELAKPKFHKILNELIELVNNGKIEILSNIILNDEWNRNKERTINTIKESIRNYAKSASKIEGLVEQEDKDKLRSVLLKYKEVEKEQINLAESHFEKINNLLENATAISISDGLKIKMADRAVNKKAPFHNTKNNMADALIIFSAIDWVNENKLIQQDLLFVSGNHAEFSNPEDINQVHTEIAQYSNKATLYFTNNIGRIIALKEAHVEDEETEAEIQLWNHIEWEAEIRRGK